MYVLCWRAIDVLLLSWERARIKASEWVSGMDPFLYQKAKCAWAKLDAEAWQSLTQDAYLCWGIKLIFTPQPLRAANKNGVPDNGE